MVCGGTSSPCDGLCGGGGCGMCGGPGCSGAKTLANSAKEMAENIEKMLKEKNMNVTEHLIPRVSHSAGNLNMRIILFIDNPPL